MAFLENPPRSRDRQNAEELISHAMPPDALLIGKRAKQSQSARARKSRVKIGENGETMCQVVEKLAAQHPTDSAKQLWSHFWTVLEEEGRSPDELQGHSVAYTYDFGGRRRKISLGRFSEYRFRDPQKKNHVSRANDIHPYTRTCSVVI